jgi:DNA-binding MarR family transcriptional regulator
MTALTDDDPRPELFGSLLVLVQHLSRRLDAALAPLGLTSRQWLLLAVIERWFPNEGPTLSEAAARYGSSRQNVKQIALGLERKGFLRLTPDRGDGRATRLALTDNIAVFREPTARALQQATLDDIFGALDTARIALLRDLIVEWLDIETGESELLSPNDLQEA